MNKATYDNYIKILNAELKPAMGCTEPIALAYIGALARHHLGAVPDKMILGASGSIIKNVKSVYVPHTDHLRGIKTALALGALLGDADKELEVISDVSKADQEKLGSYLKECEIAISALSSDHVFDLELKAYKKDESVFVKIVDEHTNVVLIKKNDEVIFEKTSFEQNIDRSIYKSLNMRDIYDFVEELKLEDVRDVLKRQLDYNVAIAKEGLKNNYGANIGKTILSDEPKSFITLAKAYAAGASDARMNGCEMPVVINSGSGNQGLTVSLPLYAFYEYYNADEEKLYRALALANLVAIYEKVGIGTLSAFCGATTAACAAGAGIAYLCDLGYDGVIHVVSNALGILSGMVCDGAKASCAAKIAIAIDSMHMALRMYMHHFEFKAGDGIIEKNVDLTIDNIGKLSSLGMAKTNEVIIEMMTKSI